MIWNPAIETMPRGELEQLQNQRLTQLVNRLYENVPFYRHLLDSHHVSPSAFRGLQDLSNLPFTRKNDLRENYPFKLFAVPRENVVRVHASSGTTGKPTVVGYTRKDIDTWAELCARCLALSGAQPGQMFQNAYGYGLFTGGLGMHYGGEKMGLTVVPVSGGNTARQMLLLQDFGTEVLSCTPSYALTLADALQEAGIPRSSLKLQTLILGAEPWTEAMRQEIEQRLQVDAVNIYGLSEIIGPGVSNECVEAKNGSHIMEDHFIPEIIDPESGQVLPEGEIGELVFTTLTKEAFPLIRYRTGDLTSLNYEKCVCGRTHARMSRVIGRSDDMLIIRGVNVFPSQIEEALTGIANITPHHQIVVTRRDRLDTLTVFVETTEDFYRAIENSDDQNPAIQRLSKEIHQKIHDILGINVRVEIRPPKSLPRSEGGKLNRLVDQRELN